VKSALVVYLSDRIYTQKPYSIHSGRDMTNADDGIYADAGETLTLDIVETDDQTLGGYKAIFNIALDLSAAPVETGTNGGPSGSRPNSTRPNGTSPPTPST
jgi:hypothetical protein